LIQKLINFCKDIGVAICNRTHFDKLARKKFEIVIDNAERYDGVGLINLVKIIGKETQGYYMSQPLYYIDNNDVMRPNSIHGLFFDTNHIISDDGKSIDKYIKKVHNTRDIDFQNDLIIPLPRTNESLSNILLKKEIFIDKNWREAKNHSISFCLPMGIGCSTHGHHSITAGVLAARGTMKNYTCYDYSELFDYIYTDGVYFYRTENSSIIERVQNFDMACIFEIGRIMKANNVSAM